MPDYVPEPLPTPTITMSERVDMFKLGFERDLSSILQAEVILDVLCSRVSEYISSAAGCHVDVRWRQRLFQELR